MKKITRILSLLLAVAMVLSLNLTTITALADDSYTITINESTSNYIYKAYQIFDGDLSGNSADGYVLSNIKWGSNVDTDMTIEGTNLISAIQALDTAFSSCTTAAAVAEVLKTYSNDSTMLQKFADVVSQYITGDGVTSEAGSSNYTITITDPGYYLVKNTSVPDEDGAYTRFILLVVGDVEADPKSDVPSVEKKVYEEDYTSTDAEKNAYGDGYNDVADYDIGDNVPFELIGTLPSNLDKYDTYKYIFHDTLDAGLTFNDDVVVTIGTQTVASSYYTIAKSTDSPATITDGCTFEVRFTDILSLYDTNGDSISVDKDSKIVVKYTAELNSSAVIGLNGNENKVKLQYSNNPNAGGSGDTGTTPEEKVIVFTYELDVTKIDGATAQASTPTTLSGAEFILYKTVTEQGSSVTYYVQVDSSNKVTGWTTDVDQASTLTSGSDGIFKVIGLDDGITYYLKETKAPTGYNLLSDPVTLVITATTANGQSWSGTASDALTALKISVNGTESDGDTGTGIVKATVENNSGATLPSTGGMGTKIFYTLGGLLVVCAGVLLIVKRRMRNA